MSEQQSDNNMLSRGIYILPNLFTLAALFSAFYSIVASLKGFFPAASVALFIAMLLDSLDGRVARLTNTMSAFGAQFDSLADMVSFGVAPAILIYSWVLYGLGKIGWLAAFIYVAAVALRLARFNTQLGSSDKRYFQGLACTPAAGVVAGLVWCFSSWGNLPHFNGFVLAIISAAVMVVLGLLQVSNVRYRSFKDLDLRKHVPFVVILLILLVIVFISLDPPRVLFAIFALYALYGPAETIWELRNKKEQRKSKNTP